MSSPLSNPHSPRLRQGTAAWRWSPARQVPGRRRCCRRSVPSGHRTLTSSGDVRRAPDATAARPAPRHRHGHRRRSAHAPSWRPGAVRRGHGAHHELRRSGSTIVVFEDVHWADEATLDVIRLVARRIDTIRAVIALSYREEELGADRPLRLMVGELASAVSFRRIPLSPLSPSAVARLAEPYGIDPQELHRTTAGNAFFVTEVLASGGTEIPATVRDAVLARAGRLSPGARTCSTPLRSRRRTPRRGCSRHSPARSTRRSTSASPRVCSSPPTVTSRSGTSSPDCPSRSRSRPPAHAAFIVSRSQRCSSGGAAIAISRASRITRTQPERGRPCSSFAPLAADHASSVGAHREAADQLARALRYAEAMPPAELALLLTRHAHECYLTDQVEDAIAALRKASASYRDQGDPMRRARRS